MKPTILMIDACELDLYGMHSLLMTDYVTKARSSVKEALGPDMTRTLDLIIMDIDLGFNALSTIMEHKPEKVPVLIYSRLPQTYYAIPCSKAGVRGYKQKQDPACSFPEAVRRILNKGLAFSDVMIEKMVTQKKNPSGFGIESLSPRELEVFTHLGQGLTTQEYADKMNLSRKTVETYREHIKRKLCLENGTQLMACAVRWAITGRVD